jgi:hypothetical protein
VVIVLAAAANPPYRCALVSTGKLQLPPPTATLPWLTVVVAGLPLALLTVLVGGLPFAFSRKASSGPNWYAVSPLPSAVVGMGLLLGSDVIKVKVIKNDQQPIGSVRRKRQAYSLHMHAGADDATTRAVSIMLLQSKATLLMSSKT